MANRQRPIPILFMVTAKERQLISQKMRLYGTRNLSAYLRKIAIDGYVLQLDLSDLKDLVSLLRRSSNNLNQVAKHAHQTGSIYREDIEDLRISFERLFEQTEIIMTRLSVLD
jgi:hypothetical protein